MTNDEIFDELLKRLEVAEGKHPVFAEGIYQALGRVSEEVGELNRATNHSEGDKRIMDEAFDSLVVIWRFIRGDWKQEAE